MKGRGEMAGKIKAEICFASLICVLALLLTSCDFRLMSKREVEEYLEKRYGQEFTVLSSESVTEDYYDNDVWRVRVHTVSPRDDLKTQFFVFNTVEGENFGVPGFANRLSDTYALDIFGRAFETRAVDTDVEYSFDYFYPAKSSSVYYSDLYVNIEPVSSENLEMVCTVLSQAYADTFEKTQVIPSDVSVMLTYQEPAWPKDQSCLIRIDSFYLSGFDTAAETIEKYILDEAGKYQERIAGNTFTDWFGKKLEQMNIIATFSLVYNAVFMVQQRMGYMVTVDNLANTTVNPDLCFRPLSPLLEAGLAIVWKKYQVFSAPAEKLLEQFQKHL